MAQRNLFLSSLAEELRAAAPKQLTFSSTEGYFAPGARVWGLPKAETGMCSECPFNELLHHPALAGDQNVGFNAGAGAECEGEDWSGEIRLFDVASVHIYYRSAVDACWPPGSALQPPR
jgi:hypothetical protein